MRTTVPQLFGEVGGLLIGVVVLLGSLAVHIALALAVRSDAAQLRDHRLGPVFLGPSLWGVAVLLGGVLTAGLYWIIHHSTLRPAAADKPPGVGEI